MRRVRPIVATSGRIDTQPTGRLEDEPFYRTEVGDVTNLRAFNKHMERVGEEDQTQPGWDAL